MKDLEVNTIISFGLAIACNISIGGWIAISIITGTSSGTEIPIAIVSGLGGVLTGKKMTEMKYKDLEQKFENNEKV